MPDTVQPRPSVLKAPVQYLDFLEEPGRATLWDVNHEDRCIPVRLGVNELGQVVVETLPR